ncbi:MAG: SDR family oxidoreductase [Candidatus Eisenbacteria bacterium]|nr:SDR family oxidoreductase [Candidatus Eisenbacteria bacterium]
MAKAGLLHLVRGLAEEGRPHGIRANAIVPGTIDTPANRAAMPNADRSSWSDPSEIARLLLVLAEGGTAVTGSVLFV